MPKVHEVIKMVEEDNYPSESLDNLQLAAIIKELRVIALIMLRDQGYEIQLKPLLAELVTPNEVEMIMKLTEEKKQRDKLTWSKYDY